MKIKYLCLIAISVIAADLLYSCSASSNDSNDQVLVEQTIDHIIGWAVDKDFNLFYSSILQDSNYVSVTPSKRVKFGFEEVRKDSAFWGSRDFIAIRHEIRDLHIHFSTSGEVAWFFCYLDDLNSWKGEAANWENARWTGVLEKIDGKWKMMQQHFSFAH